MAISLVPKTLNHKCSVMLYKGGDVSRATMEMISGMDFIERMAENPSSPQIEAVNWFSTVPHSNKIC